MPADVLERLPGHPRALLGRGAAAQLAAVLDEISARRVLVVHGTAALHRPAVAAVLDAIRPGRTVAHLGDVTPNPDLTQANRAITAARALQPDAVVGLGGGSVLDVAKIAAVFGGRVVNGPGGAEEAGAPDTTQDANAVPFLRGVPCLRGVAARTALLVLVPTILGSGSEMTRFATVYVGGVKHSLDHAAARADVVLIDPDLAAGVPVPVGVPAALDALVQAAESYWAVRGTPTSRARARLALQRLAPVLGRLRATASFTDPAVRAEIALGAALAGAAIDETRTTAAHALSYALTARRGVVHGAAVALHFRWLLAHHGAPDGDCRHPDGASGLRALVEDIETVARHGAGTAPNRLIADLLERSGQPGSLAELKLDPVAWAPLIAEALGSDRAGNNPRVLATDTVLAASTTW